MFALHAAVVVLSLTAPGETVLLDFTADWCGPCRQMQPIVQQLQSQGFPVRQVNIDHQPELASQYQVTGVPCFVMLADGREVNRIVGGTSYEQLVGLIQSAGTSQTTAAAPNMNDVPTMSTASQRFPGQRSVRPMAVLVSPAAQRRGATTSADTQPALDPFAQVAVGDLSAVNRTEATPSLSVDSPAPVRPVSSRGNVEPISDQLIDHLLAATVRIRIEDAQGNSVGTGTIIDSRSGEALVLTCGHLFRDSKGKGRITLDTFGPGAVQGVEARLIGYDADYRDVALLSFRPMGPIEVAPLALRDHESQPQEPVVSLGCSHGEDATARRSHVTSIDKFLGAANLQVAGQPVQGRSGGGLFNERGLVIGVCNAADPTDDEGLYAALGQIYEQLDELQLTALLATPAPAASLASLPPGMPKDMPAVVERTAPRGLLPTGATDNPQAAATQQSVALSPSEQAMLDELRGMTDGAEVICIVRPRNDPQGNSQVIKLDRVSPEFLRQLGAE